MCPYPPRENGVESRQAVARGAASANCPAGGGCEYTWDVVTQYGPAVFLDPHREHTLRLVRGGQEASVTVTASVRVKWYFREMFRFVLGSVRWVVDGATGSWNGFSRLDVDRAFRQAQAASAGGGRQ